MRTPVDRERLEQFMEAFGQGARGPGRVFLPPLPGWRDRSEWIMRCGPVDFFHYDLDSQALAKIARGFDQDLADVADMLREGRVDPERLSSFLRAREQQLLRSRPSAA